MPLLKYTKLISITILLLVLTSCSDNPEDADQTYSQNYELVTPKEELKAPSEYSKKLKPLWGGTEVASIPTPPPFICYFLAVGGKRGSTTHRHMRSPSLRAPSGLATRHVA